MVKILPSLLKLFLLLNVIVLMAGGASASLPGDTSTKKGPGAEWYFPEWLGSSPHAPSFEIKDTTNKYGRYATQTKTITLYCRENPSVSLSSPALSGFRQTQRQRLQKRSREITPHLAGAGPFGESV